LLGLIGRRSAEGEEALLNMKFSLLKTGQLFQINANCNILRYSPSMSLVLLQRPFLFANTISHDQHRSLPLTSLRWQQHRRISGAVAHRNRICIFSTGNQHGFAEPEAYENQLLIVQRRREELELLLEAHNRDALLRIGYTKHTIIIEQRWLNVLEDVIQFYHQEGRLPERGKNGTPENSLVIYIQNQRNAKQCLDLGKPSNNAMTPERIFVLESMPWWSWDAHEAAWEDKFEELQEYVKHGKIPPASHPTLGNWVHTQRMAYRAWQGRSNGGDLEGYHDVTHIMNEERAAKLESVPGWLWDPREDSWEAKYQELLQYVAKYNKIPPVRHPTLGQWVKTQRSAYRAWQGRLNGDTEKYQSVTEIMTEERAAKLEAIPGWKWNMRA
jgi:hypothetical protein